MTIAILAGPVGLAQDRATGPDEPARIGVRLWIARTITSRWIVEELKREVERIWTPYGIQLAWTDATSTESHRLSIQVTLERETDLPDDARAVLGRVLVAPDDPVPYPIHVSFDATRELLLRRTGPGRISLAQMVPESEMARALGRVVAHEIGHVLIGTSYHDTSGLMRANFSADMLAGPDRTPFRLTCRTARQLIRGLAAASEAHACS